MSKAPADTLKILILLCVAGILGAVLFLYRESPDQGMIALLESKQTAADFGSDLAPHKALYEIKLIGTHSGSQVINISGEMFFEWHPTCDAWISDHRFNMLYEYADTPSIRLASNFSTFESIDGKTFSFTSQRKSNGEIFEDIRGFADPSRAVYTLPEDLEFDLPESTLFPVAHTREVLRQIAAGEKFAYNVIFDGSDLEGPVGVTSFIGTTVDPADLPKARAGLDTALLESPAHKVRLAFFPLDSDQFTADYEMDMIFHENGVISDITIEYEDFTVSQKLIALEKTDSQCEENGN